MSSAVLLFGAVYMEKLRIVRPCLSCPVIRVWRVPPCGMVPALAECSWCAAIIVVGAIATAESLKFGSLAMLAGEQAGLTLLHPAMTVRV
jgi:hypothetical protein